MDVIAATFGIVMCVAIVCITSAYSCTNLNQQYYTAFNQCVSSGGSAIPTTSGNGREISCIRK